MNKKEVLVDTAFLIKLSQNGKDLESFKKVLSELDYLPVVHPYIADKEMDMLPYFTKLVNEGFVRIADYSEFLKDNDDICLYEQYFFEIHNELREEIELLGGKKKVEELILPPKMNIFTYRKAGMSLGDVHLVLMAFFTGTPVILSEDSDIKKLRSITKRRMGSESYTLEIFTSLDVLIMLAQNENTRFSKKDLIEILKHIEEKAHKNELVQAWESAHPNK